MLKKICFVLERHEDPGTEKEQEVRRALRSFEKSGIAGEVLYGMPEESGGTLYLCGKEDSFLLPGDGDTSGASGNEGTLCLCDNGEALRRLRRRGLCTAGYLHGGTRGERFSGAAYVVQEPDLVDADSYEKMYLRGAGLPWKILETARCEVREFTEEDLEDLYLLYDEEAKKFLEPPSEDREREREILRAYIDRVYGLYGFGHWAVLLKETASSKRPALAGRVGYAVLTAEQEQEAARLGARGGIDADFGFLIAPQLRGTGIAFEVCSALLRFGFSHLGFARVRADAGKENIASLRLLRRLGFTLLGEGDDGKLVFLLDTARKEGNYDQSTFSFHAES